MMKYYARFNATDFKLTSEPSISDSSRETKFSDIEIDFRGFADTLLPIQYQEVKVVQIDDSLVETELFTGYVDTVDYPEFTSDDTPFIITLSLLSPYTYASKRSITTTINTISLNIAVLTILAPLLDDGFTIEENSLSNNLLTAIFKFESIEKIMNYLANKFNFIWYIDKNKKIYLIDIDILKGQESVLDITETNRCYLKSIKPTRSVVDYANKLNIKNIISVSGQTNLIPAGTILKSGETYNFTYPISISENVAYRLSALSVEDGNFNYAFMILTNVAQYSVTIDLDNKSINYNANIGFLGIDDDTSKKILLQTSDTDITKVVGFKWNSSDETVASSSYVYSYSGTSLVPTNATYIDPVEVGNIKDKINTSGVIEKIVDANGKYFVGSELFNYAISLFSQNKATTNQIKCTFKGKINDSSFMEIISKLKITKVFGVNITTFGINNKFIITDINLKYNTETIELDLNARNYNLNESFLDIFRNSIDENSTDDLTNNIVVFYNQDNKTIISNEVYVNGEVVNK